MSSTLLTSKTTTMPKNKRFTMLLLAVTAGATTFSLVSPAFAKDDKNEKVTICWNNRTISVPRHTYENSFLPRGATLGPAKSALSNLESNGQH